MNENLNLKEILKDCPRGTKLYSPLFGEVNLDYIDFDAKEFPIAINSKIGHVYFTQTGRYNYYEDQECMLFPSKNQRDWSKFKVKKPKFDPETLQPFDRMLVKDKSNGKWFCSLFSYIDNELIYPVICINGLAWECSIPYNDDTKHLVGTAEKAPEYYRYWED